jgi:hypothetical protein
MFFLDFEASGLLPGSYPIEVAWASHHGNPESYLIKPHDDWLRSGSWDFNAEAMHGLTHEQLLADGTPVDHIAARLVDALHGWNVFAGSGMDQGWLDALLEYGSRSEQIRLMPVEIAYGDACRALLALVPPGGDSCRKRR